MFFFAAVTQTAADRLKQIPLEFWWKAALGVVIVIAAVIFLRKVAKVNKLFLALGVFLAATIIGFNWIYERNEPAWATPAVQWLAGFFPTKASVNK